MKIAFLSVFYPYRGGIAHFNSDLYKGFVNEGHEVKVFNFSLQYPKILFPGKTQYVNDGDDIEAIDSERVLNSVNPLSYFKTANRIKDFEPDILFIGYWMPFVGPSLGFVGNKLKKTCKVISVVHNAIPHEKKFIDKPFTKYFLNRNHGFVTLSDAVKKDIESLKADAKCKTVKHPVYTHFGEILDNKASKIDLGIDSEKKVVLFFGLIRDYKGLDLLIDAMKKLPEDYHLLIVGEVYTDIEIYNKSLAEDGIKNRFTFISEYVPDNEVNKYFSAADVCVLPYKSATQSGITIIANHFNVPLIVTDVGGLKETITEGKTGMVVPERTVKSLSDTIKAYFDRNCKEAMAKAIEIEKKENTWEHMASQIVEFSKSL